MRIKTFPMFIKIAGQRIAIIGDGEEAAAKLRRLMKTDAEISLFSPALRRDAMLRCELDHCTASGGSRGDGQCRR